MTVLHFEYRMEINYEKQADRCYFTIKCIPRENARQHLQRLQLDLSPQTDYSFAEDSFGNRKLYGCVLEPHDHFVFQATGAVEITQTDYEEEVLEETLGIFLTPHGKCIPGPQIQAYYQALDLAGCQNQYDICLALMHRLHQDFAYLPGATQVQTTAEEALCLGKGVCQDYAHIYVTLLRLAGIPARYVCGLIVGEGASHAWVEAACGGRWLAFDPTHDCPVLDHYIKLGHGRDAADCAINRGLMWNSGEHEQKINVLVEKQEA